MPEEIEGSDKAEGKSPEAQKPKAPVAKADDGKMLVDRAYIEKLRGEAKENRLAKEAAAAEAQKRMLENNEYKQLYETTSEKLARLEAEAEEKGRKAEAFDAIEKRNAAKVEAAYASLSEDQQRLVDAQPSSLLKLDLIAAFSPSQKPELPAAKPAPNGDGIPTDFGKLPPEKQGPAILNNREAYAEWARKQTQGRTSSILERFGRKKD